MEPKKGANKMKCINCGKEMSLVPNDIQFICLCGYRIYNGKWINSLGLEVSPIKKREDYPKAIIQLDDAVENLKSAWAELMAPIKKAWNEGLENMNAAMDDLKKKLGEDDYKPSKL